jgi:GT2 family glycosyltransferase
MADLIGSDAAIVAVAADISNHDWPMPTPAWRWYLRWVLGLGEGEWQGRVVGPLLRFGYRPRPAVPAPMEWFGTANTMVRRSAYDAAGGFSDFFLRRSTMNEDVDLGLRVGRHGRILLCPSARMSHHHEPAGRVSVSEAAEDDLYNRYLILRRTLGLSRLAAFAQVVTFYAIESISNLIGAARRRQSEGLWPRLAGRSMAIVRILSGYRGAQ